MPAMEPAQTVLLCDFTKEPILPGYYDLKPCFFFITNQIIIYITLMSRCNKIVTPTKQLS